MAKKLNFITILKVIIALIPIGIKIFKEINRKEDENEKSKFLEALQSGDVSALHKLLGDLSDADTVDPDRPSEDSPEAPKR